MQDKISRKLIFFLLLLEKMLYFKEGNPSNVLRYKWCGSHKRKQREEKWKVKT